MVHLTTNSYSPYFTLKTFFVIFDPNKHVRNRDIPNRTSSLFHLLVPRNDKFDENKTLLDLVLLFGWFVFGFHSVYCDLFFL